MTVSILIASGSFCIMAIIDSITELLTVSADLKQARRQRNGHAIECDLQAKILQARIEAELEKLAGKITTIKKEANLIAGLEVHVQRLHENILRRSSGHDLEKQLQALNNLLQLVNTVTERLLTEKQALIEQHKNLLLEE